MRQNSLAILWFAAALSSLVGCSSPGGYYDSGTASQVPASGTAVSGYAVVQAIDLVPRPSGGVTVGTVGGALAGGLLGSQIGSGSGQTAATIAGAAGGALIGREIEKSSRANQQVYRITLRMDNGSLQSVLQEVAPIFRIGERVRVVNGVIYS